MTEAKEAQNVGADGMWPLPVVIAAGGKGTRLRPFTNSIPKELVEVNGTPIIDRIIAQFRARGCEEFWATMDYHAEKLEEHFENVDPGHQVRLVNANGHRGTAAPLKVLQGLVDPPFVLSNCDVLVDADYPAIAREGAENGDALTLIAYRHRRVIPAGAVELAADGGFRGFAPRREMLSRSACWELR